MTPLLDQGIYQWSIFPVNKTKHGCNCNLPGEMVVLVSQLKPLTPWPGPEKGNWMVTLKTWRFISQTGEWPPPKELSLRKIPQRFVDFPRIFQVSLEKKVPPPSSFAKVLYQRCITDSGSRWLKPGVCCRKKKKKKGAEKREQAPGPCVVTVCSRSRCD